MMLLQERVENEVCVAQRYGPETRGISFMDRPTASPTSLTMEGDFGEV